MRERVFAIMAAVALLFAVMLPVFSSALAVSGGRAGSQQTSHEQVARRGADAMCQSGFACGG
jgi:hypothetical protein